MKLEHEPIETNDYRHIFFNGKVSILTRLPECEALIAVLLRGNPEEYRKYKSGLKCSIPIENWLEIS